MSSKTSLKMEKLCLNMMQQWKIFPLVTTERRKKPKVDDPEVDLATPTGNMVKF
jgi:hypothetical protein